MKQKKQKRAHGLSEEQAAIKAKSYNALAKHNPNVSYQVVELSKTSWGVGQFYNDKQVAIVVS